jgi:hypothetical protein
MKRGRKVENWLALLDGGNPSGRKGTTVADPVHLVEDRDTWVAGAQKVGMQRVNGSLEASPIRDRPSSCNQRLCSDLAPEDAKSMLGRAETTVEVDFELLEVEQGYQAVQGLRHPPIMPR